MAKKNTQPKPTPLEMLEVKHVAALLGCSPRHVKRMSRAGRMPSPIKLGTLVRWRHADLLAWMDAGCPSMRDREAVRHG